MAFTGRQPLAERGSPSCLLHPLLACQCPPARPYVPARAHVLSPGQGRAKGRLSSPASLSCRSWERQCGWGRLTLWPSLAAPGHRLLLHVPETHPGRARVVPGDQGEAGWPLHPCTGCLGPFGDATFAFFHPSAMSLCPHHLPEITERVTQGPQLPLGTLGCHPWELRCLRRAPAWFPYISGSFIP